MNLITNALENGENCNALFLDLTKAFDCMCHETFLGKMEHYGFRGTSLSLLRSYLSNRRQYVVSNQQQSRMRPITSGVAQGSLTGALFFIIYTNDLPLNITADVVLYADDTTLLLHGNEPTLSLRTEAVKHEASDWFAQNRLILNTDKTSELLITASRRNQQDGSSAKFLGITIDTRLTWRPHVEDLLPVLSTAIYAVRRIRETVNTEAAKATYYALFHSRMTYGLRMWGSSAHGQRIFLLQKKAIRAIERVPPTDSCRPLFRRHKILTLHGAYILQHLLHTKKQEPLLIHNGIIHDHYTRRRDQLRIPFNRLHTTDFITEGLHYFNHLPQSWKTLNPTTFKKTVTQLLTDAPPYSTEEFMETIQRQFTITLSTD